MDITWTTREDKITMSIKGYGLWVFEGPVYAEASVSIATYLNRAIYVPQESRSNWFEEVMSASDPSDPVAPMIAEVVELLNRNGASRAVIEAFLGLSLRGNKLTTRFQRGELVANNGEQSHRPIGYVIASSATLEEARRDTRFRTTLEAFIKPPADAPKDWVLILPCDEDGHVREGDGYASTPEELLVASAVQLVSYQGG